MSSSLAPSNHGMRLLHPQPAGEHPVGAVDHESREPEPEGADGVPVDGGHHDQQRQHGPAGGVEVHRPGRGALGPGASALGDGSRRLHGEPAHPAARGSGERGRIMTAPG